MPEGSDIAGLLASLGESYAGRGVELAERGGKWHFQTAPDLGHILRREREESRRLSRAAIETLAIRSEEHTSELQSLMRISYAVFCLKKKKEQHYAIQ